MHKFATVYKAAMRKAADANTDYVDSIRVRQDEAESPDKVKARHSYIGDIGTPGFFARLNEVYGKDYPETWAKRRDEINNATTPMDFFRVEFPAIQPAKRPEYRRALNEEKAKLQAQPKATTWSQLGAGIKDVVKDPIQIRDYWMSPAMPANTLGWRQELRESLRDFNPNSTTK